MSRLIELDLNPPQRILRQFGYIACAAFGLFALCALRQWLMFDFELGAARLPVAGALAAAGVLSLAFSLVAPAANRPLYSVLALVTFPIGFVMSYVIMAVLFYAVVAPTGFLLRMGGRDPLSLGWERGRDSYWLTSRPRRGAESYFKQF